MCCVLPGVENGKTKQNKKTQHSPSRPFIWLTFSCLGCPHPGPITFFQLSHYLPPPPGFKLVFALCFYLYVLEEVGQDHFRCLHTPSTVPELPEKKATAFTETGPTSSAVSSKKQNLTHGGNKSPFWVL